MKISFSTFALILVITLLKITDVEAIEPNGPIKNCKLIGLEFVKSPNILRHDSELLAKAIMKLGLLESLKN